MLQEDLQGSGHYISLGDTLMLATVCLFVYVCKVHEKLIISLLLTTISANNTPRGPE